MCVGLPGQVVEIVDPEHGLVRVDIAGRTHDVSAAILEEPVAVGDWLEVHMGHALNKLSAEEAQEMLSFMEELDAAHRALFEGGGGEEE